MREPFTVLAVCFGWCMEDFEEVDENLERRRESSESRIRAADQGNGRLPLVFCVRVSGSPRCGRPKRCVVVTKGVCGCHQTTRRKKTARATWVWCRFLMLLRPVRVLCLPTLPQSPTKRLYLLPMAEHDERRDDCVSNTMAEHHVRESGET